MKNATPRVAPSESITLIVTSTFDVDSDTNAVEKYPISPALYDVITSPDSVVVTVGEMVISGKGLTS